MTRNSMLSRAQEKLIRSLKTKKGREKSQRCLVEGPKLLRAAGDLVEFTFSDKDTKQFDQLVTTTTPQKIAGVALLPQFDFADITECNTVVVLDGVQDPGNVGAALRLCQGFPAGLLLVDSADPTNPKVIRSSAGAVFHTPWMSISRSEAENVISRLDRDIYRLEKADGAIPIEKISVKKPLALIAGSEGTGIQLPVDGQSIQIQHEETLESLNVANALAIALYLRARA